MAMIQYSCSDDSVCSWTRNQPFISITLSLTVTCRLCRTSPPRVSSSSLCIRLEQKVRSKASTRVLTFDCSSAAMRAAHLSTLLSVCCHRRRSEPSMFRVGQRMSFLITNRSSFSSCPLPRSVSRATRDTRGAIVSAELPAPSPRRLSAASPDSTFR